MKLNSFYYKFNQTNYLLSTRATSYLYVTLKLLHQTIEIFKFVCLVTHFKDYNFFTSYNKNKMFKMLTMQYYCFEKLLYKPIYVHGDLILKLGCDPLVEEHRPTLYYILRVTIDPYLSIRLFDFSLSCTQLVCVVRLSRAIFFDRPFELITI